MGFRFRKTIGIIPGVRINLSKTGVSASVGGKGATVNVGSKGVTGTVGVPGTGMSYRKSLTPTGLELARKGRWGKWWLLALVVLAALAFFYARRELPKLMKPSPASAPAATIAAAPTVATPAGHKVTVTAPTANCRTQPARDGKVELKLGQGDVADETARSGGWVHVSTGVINCWVSSRTVKRTD